MHAQQSSGYLPQDLPYPCPPRPPAHCWVLPPPPPSPPPPGPALSRGGCWSRRGPCRRWNLWRGAGVPFAGRKALPRAYRLDPTSHSSSITGGCMHASPMRMHRPAANTSACGGRASSSTRAGRMGGKPWQCPTARRTRSYASAMRCGRGATNELRNMHRSGAVSPSTRSASMTRARPVRRRSSAGLTW